jgi:hypothetical protein
LTIDPMEIAFILVIVVVVVGMVGYLAYLAEKKRREALFALAQKLGWRFDPSRDHRHDREYANFALFRRGHSRCAFNTLTGEMTIQDRRYAAKMGDFRYKITSGSGKNRRTRTYTFSYLIVDMPFRGTPPLLIRREGMFDKLAGFFGFGDINFESAEFSRRFHVSSSDRKFAYDVITARMMEFLLTSDPLTIDIEHNRLCLSDGRRTWQPDEFERRVQWVEQFFDLWPKHVKVALEG